MQRQTIEQLRRPRALVAAAVLATLVPGIAHAGATIPFGDGESFSIGMGMRGSFTSESSAAPNGSDRSANFSLDSIRLYMGAQLNPYIKATFNTEHKSDGSLYVLDGFVQFELDPAFNIWAGRLLPPSDRSNLDGPYYQSGWDYPGVASNYYSLETGRDDGVVLWGKVDDKKVVYSLGLMQGRNHTGVAPGNTSPTGSSNQSANLLYAGRLSVSFLDAEPAPAYFTGSTYFGGAHLFTVGVAGQYQSQGVGDVANSSNYQAYNIDFLFEQPVGTDSLDISGAYYKYSYSTAAFAADYSGGSGIVPPGTSYLLDVAYLFGTKIGVGKLQPFARYQKFNIDGGSGETQYDLGLHYVIKGSDARLSALYRHDDKTGSTSVSSNALIAGFQVQF